jgi:ankyrin repeat protein
MGTKNNTQQNELLLSAVKKNEITAAKEALKNGADINLKDKKEATILMWAAYKINLDFVKYLVDNGADYQKKGIIDDGNGGFYGNLNGIATIKGDLEMLQYFIDDLKIDIDDLEQQVGENPGWSALQWAISKDQTAIIKYLLTAGANPNPVYAKQTSLHGVIRNQNLEIFELLVEAGASIKNDKFITLLAEACRNEKQAFIKRLLELGANPNDLNHGAPALLYAVGYGNLERCKLLIFNGANPHFADKFGNTALTLAKRMEHQIIVEYLEKI